MCKGRKDTYRNYEHLNSVEKENIDYLILVKSTKSPIVVLTPHGGCIEPHTSKIALRIADEKHNLYLFEGIKRGGNCVLHITSTNFDEPRGVKLVTNSDIAIAVHGKNCAEEYLEIGGANNDLAEALRQALNAAGFDARQPSGPNMAGKDLDNICNRAKRHGVQLEMCRGLRNILGDTANKRRLALFAESVRTAAENYLAANNKK